MLQFRLLGQVRVEIDGEYAEIGSARNRGITTGSH